MRTARHRLRNPFARAARRGTAVLATGTAAVLVATLAGNPLAQADPQPSTPASVTALAGHPAYSQVFDDLSPADALNLEPLIEAVRRNAEAVRDALAGLTDTIDAVQTDVSELLDALPALVDAVGEDPGSALEVVQAAVSAQLMDLAGVGLLELLDLVGTIAAPSCYTLGAVTAALPDLGVLPLPTDLFGPLAPVVEQIDRGASDALLEIYTQAFALLIAPPDLPAGADALAPFLALASGLLSLLAVDVETTYYSEGDEPLVRNTPGLLNLPVLLDVDGRLGYDLCAITGIDLGAITSGDVTGLEISQTISRLPLRKTPVEVDVEANFFAGLFSMGYRAEGSQAPTIYETQLSLTGPAVDTTLLGQGDALVQTAGLALGSAAAELTWATEDPPDRYTFASATAGGAGGNGTQYTYTGSEPGSSFAYRAAIGTLSAGIAQAPAATSFSYCTSARGYCSNQPGVDPAVQTASMHFDASEPVTVTQTLLGSSACPGLAVGIAQLTGTQLYLGAKVPTASSSPGNIWVDTDNVPVSGCVHAGGFVANLPSGFAAQDRRALWDGVPGFLQPPRPVTAKSGTVNCGTATVFAGVAVVGFNFHRYFCSFPPANAVLPTPGSVTTAPVVGSTRTATSGTWTPAAATNPNGPSFAYQWQRCNADLSVCTPVLTGTTAAYPVTVADSGFRLRVVVTATNFDGTATATSAATPAVPLPA